MHNIIYTNIHYPTQQNTHMITSVCDYRVPVGCQGDEFCNIQRTMKIKYFDLNEVVKGKKERTFVAYHKLLTQSKVIGTLRVILLFCFVSRQIIKI